MKLKKFIAVLSGLVLFSALTLIFLVNRKVITVQDALKQLVYSKTKGQYELTIKGYSVRPNPFTLTFDSLQIIHNDSLPDNVHQVIIPNVSLTLGSVIEFLQGDQLDIQAMSVENPIIKIKQGTTLNDENFRFSKQVASLYPAILTVLERFNVINFEIKQASVDINKNEKKKLELRFIDLLLEHWNVKRLLDNRQFRLSMGKQGFDISKGKFDFASLVYDFKKRQLLLSNFEYHSMDSSTQTSMSITGEHIAFWNLNHDELFHNQRLMYQKLQVHRPIINAHINLRSEKKSSLNTQKLITDLVRATAGEFHLDSAILQNAAIHLTLHNKQDSIVLDLPDVTVKTDHIQVIPDQVYQIGNVVVDMHQTSLKLKNDFAISFDRISFNKVGRFVVTDLNIFQPNKSKPLALIPSIEITQLDLLKAITTKRMEAKEIKIWNARFTLTKDLLQAKSDQHEHSPLPFIHLNQVKLYNLSAEVNDGKKNIRVHGLSSTLQQVKTDSLSNITFQLDDLSANTLFAELPDKQLELTVADFHLGGRLVSSQSIELKKEQLTIALKEVKAENQNSIHDPRIIDHTAWNSLSLSDLSITGTQKIVQPAQENFIPIFGIHKISIENIDLNLQSGDTSLIADAHGVELENLNKLSALPISFSLISGFSDHIKLTTGQTFVALDSIRFQWPKMLAIHTANFTNAENSVSIEKLKMLSIQKEVSTWRIHQLSSGAVIFNKANQFRISMDSLHTKNAQWNGSYPSLQFAEVYKPLIQIGELSPKKGGTFSWNRQWINEFIIHPGSVILKDQQPITFGKIQSNVQRKEVDIEEVSHTMPKVNFKIKHIVLADQELSIDTVAMYPNEEWYQKNYVEDSKLKVILSKLNISNQAFDSLLHHQKLNPFTLSLGNMNVFVIRDKQLPDPPEIEKPWSLPTLLKLPPVVPLKKIQVKNGDISIHEISDKTGQTGIVEINQVQANIDLADSDGYTDITVDARAKLYNQGYVQLNYTTPHADTFKLTIRVNDFELKKLNQIIIPSQSMEIQSGIVNRFRVEVIATNEGAIGAAGIGYKKLHISLRRKDDLSRTGLASGLLTFIADGFVLKNSRKWVRTKFTIERIKHKSVFNYWVRLSARGAIEVVLNGK